VPAGIVLLVAAAALLIWRLFFVPVIPENVVALSGRIEGDDSAHFTIITRSALIEVSGLDALWRDFAALFAFTALLLILSVLRYRKQLA
jgi:hypothetical protein